MSGGVTTVKRVITSLTPLQPATPIANPTTLHALEFPLPQGGSLVCLTPKESIPAYENLYEKYGITCTTNTTVGYCGDDGIYRFPEYAARSDPDNADIAFAIELRLRKVRNQAPNSRKAAYQALRTIAKDVPQSMHQVFWEEATRILLTTPKSKTAHLNVKHLHHLPPSRHLHRHRQNHRRTRRIRRPPRYCGPRHHHRPHQNHHHPRP